jgi:hypothetical protein
MEACGIRMWASPESMLVAYGAGYQSDVQAESTTRTSSLMEDAAKAVYRWYRTNLGL